MLFPLSRMIHKIRCIETKGSNGPDARLQKKESALPRGPVIRMLDCVPAGIITMHSLFLYAQRVTGLWHRA